MYFYIAEAVRFELTEHFCSSVFKTGAINRTRPHFHLAGPLGIEPKLTESKSAVLPLHNVPTKKLKFLKKNKKPLDFLGLGVCGILDF